MRIIGMVALTVAAGLSASAVPAAAQTPGLRASTELSAQQRARRARPRVTVVPSERLYRQCVDWYQVEHRPSGTVITPQMRCRWAIH